MDYLIRTSEGLDGPFTINQLKRMWFDGKLTKRDEFSTNEGADWEPLHAIVEKLEGSDKPAQEGPSAAEAAADAARLQMWFSANKKSPAISAILNIIIPGAGHMYCGETFTGLLVLVITIAVGVATLGYGLFVIYPILLITGATSAARKNSEMVNEMYQ